MTEALRQLAKEEPDEHIGVWFSLLRDAATERDVPALRNAFATVPPAQRYIVAGIIADVVQFHRVWDDERDELIALLRASDDPIVAKIVAERFDGADPAGP